MQVQFGRHTPVGQKQTTIPRFSCSVSSSDSVLFSGKSPGDKARAAFAKAVQAGDEFTMGASDGADVRFPDEWRKQGISGNHGRFVPTDDPEVWTFHDTSTFGMVAYQEGKQVGETSKGQEMTVRIGNVLEIGRNRGGSAHCVAFSTDPNAPRSIDPEFYAAHAETARSPIVSDAASGGWRSKIPRWLGGTR